MKKRTIVLFLVVCVLMIGLTGCGTSTESTAMPESHTPTEVAAVEKADNGTTPDRADAASKDLTSGPATILPRLQKAYNNKDLYAITECFDPSAANAFFGVAKLLGFEADALKSIMPFFSTAIGASGMVDSPSWGKVTLAALDYEINGTDATLEYNVSLDMDDGSHNSFDSTLACVLIDNVWYISLTQPMAEFAGGSEAVAPIPVRDDITEADVAELYTFEGNGLIGILNQSAKVIIDPFFEDIGSLDYDYIPVRKNRKWGLMDRMGNLVVNYQFEAIKTEPGHANGDGYFEVQYNGKWGLLNVKTGESIPCKYDEIGEMCDGVAPAKEGDFWGVIDNKGNVVSDFIYDDVTSGREIGRMFHHKLLGVEFNKCLAVIEQNGEIYAPFGEPCSIMTYNKVVISENYVACGTFEQMFRIYIRSTGALLDIPKEYDDQFVKYAYECADGGIIIYVTPSALSSDRYGNTIHFDRDGNLLWSQPSKGFEPFDDKSHFYIIQKGGNNIIGEDGNSILPDGVLDFCWTGSRIFSTSDYKTTEVYDCDGNMICTVQNSPFTGDSVLHRWRCTDTLKGIYFALGGSKSNPKGYYEFATDSFTEFSFTDCEYVFDGNYEDYILCNNFIVGDGTFKGLLSGGELVGSGMKYHSIKYDRASDLYIFQIGNNEEHYRIGRDGTIVQVK